MRTGLYRISQHMKSQQQKAQFGIVPSLQGTFVRKGALVSVMLLGAFLAMTWVSAFILFLVRE